jgi:hypothetical protein
MFKSIFVALVLTCIVSYTVCIEDFVYGCTLYTASSSLTQTVEVTNKALLDCHDEANIFWSYPQDNLLMTLQYDENASKPFRLCLTDLKDIYYDISLFHNADGQETRIDTEDNRLAAKDGAEQCYNSDSNNVVVVKAYGTKVPKYYGVFIKYRIEA